MNVIEFIREKTGSLQQNNADFIAKLEPKFRNWSDLLNDRISNTLNNPWFSRFNPFEDDEQESAVSQAAENTYKSLKKKIGKVISQGE